MPPSKQASLLPRLASIPLVHGVADSVQHFAAGRAALRHAAAAWDTLAPTSVDRVGCRVLDMLEHLPSALVRVRETAAVAVCETARRARVRSNGLQAACGELVVRISVALLQTRLMQHTLVPVIAFAADRALPALQAMADGVREQLVYWAVLSKVSAQTRLGLGSCQ